LWFVISSLADKGVSGETMTKKIVAFIKRIIQGIVIGGGAILPGISGGVLCVTFGLYQPMMAVLAHPKTALKKYYKMFIPVVIGWALGFWGFAGIIEKLFEANAVLAISVFIGLIVGSMPSLWKEAGKQGRTKGSWIGLVVSLAAMLTFFICLENNDTALSIQPNMWWFGVCGILWGLSLIIPGMTSSSTLIFLGLFTPMTAGIASLDMGVLIPMGVGILITILGLARAVNYFFEKKYSIAFHCVVGFVIASTLVIIPRQFAGVGEVLLAVLLFVVGFVAAYLLDKFGDKSEK